MIYSFFIFHRSRCIFANWDTSSSGSPSNSNWQSSTSRNQQRRQSLGNSSDTGVTSRFQDLSLQQTGTVGQQQPQNRQHLQREQQTKKLLSGLLFSISKFCEQANPEGGKTPGGSFSSYTTPQYKLHYFETPSGYKFACLTSPEVPSLSEYLRQIYSIFVELLVQSPGFSPSAEVTCPFFSARLRQFLQSIPQANS